MSCCGIYEIKLKRSSALTQDDTKIVPRWFKVSYRIVSKESRKQKGESTQHFSSVTLHLKSANKQNNYKHHCGAKPILSRND